ncbi:MAG TPA: hypothetical protein VIE65_17795 [Methylobacter sp.]|jgi:hypothetical protein
MDFIGVFISGFFYEWTSVYWTHYSEKNQAFKAGLASAAQALTLIFGVGESIHNWKHIPFFVLGYATGSYSAVKVKSRG